MAAKTRTLPDLGYLRECFDFDAETGRLIWCARPASHFKRECDWKAWITRSAGKIAGSADSDGYLKISLGNTKYRAHRVVYAIAYGRDPGDLQIDHVDGNPSNNRPENLRLATHAENLQNSAKPFRNSASGIRGVHWNASMKKWQAQISVNSRTKYLGCFDTPELAAAAYARAAIKYRGQFAASTFVDKLQRRLPDDRQRRLL